jgi:DNA-binding MarR family transcriptional regulator
MSLDITPSQMQKTLVFLAIQQKNAKDTYFQDIVTHLERNKSQVSTLLGTLENAYLIERSNTRPQRIKLTPEGNETMQTQIKNIL